MPIQSKLNPDIQEERSKVTFNVEEFTNWFYGGAANVKERRFLEDYFLNDPELENKLDMSYLSHKEKYEESVRRVTVALKKVRKLQSEGWSETDLNNKVIHGLPFGGILRAGHPFVTHFGMFVPTLRNFGTPEQQAEWVDKAWKCIVTGSYVQTELGHGTFVRGIETTAIYDPQSQEFVIHSPSIKAYKWWPGGLAHTVNHSVVFAMLYIRGKSYGLQPFIVQLRDMETHKPMKGIIIGEIGPKIGFGSTNNGFLGFDSVRVPLKNMLMKHARVMPDGEFREMKSPILTYGIMTLVRVFILKGQATLLAQASTIAMRYSTVRRQSPIDPKAPEPKIIEHVTQQMKIFPVIAKAIVFHVTSENLFALYTQVMSEIEDGNLERLPEFHAISCCLKAVCTNESVKDIQTLRLACGGHGYLISAGFHDLFGNAAAAHAYEGENTVMLLQTSRFMLKAWKQALSGGNLTSTVAYFKNYVNRGGTREQWDSSLTGILRALQASAAGKIGSAFKRLEERKKFSTVEEATNQTSIELANAADIHCQAYFLESSIKMLESSTKTVSPILAGVLRDVVELYAVDLALRSLGNFLQFVNISSLDIENLQKQLEVSLKKFKDNAIGIVDGFDIPDQALSALGAYDGNVYERLLDAAKTSPLNQEDVNQSFEKYLKPYMKSNL